MKKQITITLLGVLFIFTSCGTTKETAIAQPQILRDYNTFLITEISNDKTYGLTPENPVEVGGVKDSEGPLNERRYLNALTGPNGEKISYFRAGSCCPVNSENGFMGKAMLDNYRVSWENSKDTVSIFINMYDSGKLKAPFGFGLKK
ncbi:2-dehydro-3-deoxyphosphooctonate aldolase [Salinimicrobium flavum]|uniref:2-dehydro-3-deoxyphosphooctonate aldolase n=1 Tax=Salinimicrobium flavum TaxID=1737065 RepID=A0ABW5IVA6_9FLAO